MEWSRIRAFVLQELARGLTPAQVGGMLGRSSQRVTQLREEGCEAALRWGVPSLEAEQACSSTAGILFRLSASPVHCTLRKEGMSWP